jgi:hypothetical protein
MIREINGITYNPPFSTDNGTITGTISETILGSVLIPANTFRISDIFGVQTRIRKATALGTVVVRMRVGPTESTTEPLCAVYSSTTAANTYIPFSRRFSIVTVSGDTRVIPNTSTATNDLGNVPSAGITKLSTDWSVDNYIIITTQASSASESLNCPYIKTDFLQSISPS